MATSFSVSCRAAVISSCIRVITSASSIGPPNQKLYQLQQCESQTPQRLATSTPRTLLFSIVANDDRVILIAQSAFNPAQPSQGTAHWPNRPRRGNRTRFEL